MRLRAGIFLLVTLIVLCALFVFGKVTGGFFAWFLFYFVLIIAVYETFTLFGSTVALQVRRNVSAQRLTAGQSLRVRVRVVRRGVWPLFWVRMREDLPSRWLFQAVGLDQVQIPLWRRRLQFEYTIKHLPRGIYHLGDTTLEAGDLLGINRIQRRFTQSDKVIVYPKIVPVHGWTGLSPDEMGERQPTNRRSEESNNVIGVREYVRGDKLSRIHWPMSARRGQLLAKEFEQHVTSEFLFVPDNTVHSYQGESQLVTFDMAMSITASLIRNAYDSHRKFGMVVPIQPYLQFPSGLDPALLGRCMETLAGLQVNGQRDIVSFLRRVGQDATRGTVFVVVTPKLDRDMAVAVAQLRQQGPVQLFVPMAGERLSDAQRQGYEMVGAAGAQIHLIRNPDGLSFLHRGGAVSGTWSTR